MPVACFTNSGRLDICGAPVLKAEFGLATIDFPITRVSRVKAAAIALVEVDIPFGLHAVQ